jgi:diacylglycerol O-acyltransferase
MTSGPIHLAVSGSPPAGGRLPGRDVAPRRLLVISATTGRGHNAAAAAVEEQAGRLWPGCEIRRVDTLDTMGRLLGLALRLAHRVSADRTAWLSGLCYRRLWRQPWFAEALGRLTGAWSGRALRPVVAEFLPDLVVSTYPLGTAGLDWLRRRGGLDLPVAAIVADFVPHPFRVYPEIDLHYVASEPGLQAMWRARPDTRGAVGAPPVASAFHPVGSEDRAAARAAFGLPPDRPVVVISLGPAGSGPVRRAVHGALAADPGTCVVVACGRNEALRRRLVGGDEPTGRLVALGWTDRMPELISAADVVITGAGGAGALEALATSRPVLLFEPIAGHGEVNAALMEQAGLGRVCADPGQLTAALRGLLRSPDLRAAAERRAAEHTGGLDFTAEVAALPGLPRHRGSRPLAAADALFVAAASEEVPQQVGAVALLDHSEAAALDPERIAVGLRARLLARSAQLPVLRRRLWLRPGRRPRWLDVDDLDPARHITSRVVRAGAGLDWAEALREFFDVPLPLDRPPWQLQVLREAEPRAVTGAAAGERTAVLVKLHHSLGGEQVAVATLAGLLSDRPAPGLRAVPPVERAHRTRGSAGRTGARRLGGAMAELGDTLRAAARTPRPNSPSRHYTLVRVRVVARRLGTSTSALLLGLLGEALYRQRAPATGVARRLRTMVPMTARGGPGTVGSEPTSALFDLPVGAMSVLRRIDEVADALDRPGAARSVAARFAVRALGRLPGVAQARFARLVYGGRFFGLVASVLPDWRRELRLLGALVTSVHPVLPLADGVALAVGYLSWGEVLGVGVTGDSALFPDADGLADNLLGVFAELAGDIRIGRTGELAGRL